MICTLCEDSGWGCQNHPYLSRGERANACKAAALMNLVLAAIRVAYIFSDARALLATIRTRRRASYVPPPRWPAPAVDLPETGQTPPSYV
jgi:hypothetical protein